MEYILLMAVISAVSFAFFKSRMFRDYFGETGTFATAFRQEIEFSYRHALPGKEPTVPIYPEGQHPSYINLARGKSRFFGPLQAYPEP